MQTATRDPAAPARAARAATPLRAAADGAASPPPAAVVAVLPDPEQPRGLANCLLALSRSQGPAGLPLAPHGLAVLVLADSPAASRVAAAWAPQLRFPLAVLPATDRPLDTATAWAESLGAPDAPVLLTTAGSRVAPDWAYTLAEALRDGAEAAQGPVHGATPPPGFFANWRRRADPSSLGLQARTARALRHAGLAELCRLRTTPVADAAVDRGPRPAG
ncbi:hypothetical protein [Roseomonas sp. BN140053]|uniref:hypothetical protein n=1 Tax=Roseomonas sp. BN140053 TaxID=3391898 RepID=UPI0039ED4045